MILLIGTFPEPIGGVSIHLDRLHDFLLARGIKCVRLDESRKIKSDILQLRKLSLICYYKMLLASDLVHIHTSNAVLRLVHVVCARIACRPSILTVHSLTAPSRSWLSRALYKTASRLANITIFVSERVRTGLNVDGLIIPAFLPPGLKDESINEATRLWISARQSEGLKVICSNASRLNRFQGEDLYGLDLAIEALSDSQISDRFACVFLVSSCEGAQDYFQSCKQTIAVRRLENRFLLLHGAQPFAGIVKSSDLLLRATNTDGDALSVREAIWYGKRVVASDCAVRPKGVATFATRDLASLKACLTAVPDEEAPENPHHFGDDILAVYSRLSKVSGRLAADARD